MCILHQILLEMGLPYVTRGTREQDVYEEKNGRLYRTQ